MVVRACAPFRKETRGSSPDKTEVAVKRRNTPPGDETCPTGFMARAHFQSRPSIWALCSARTFPCTFRHCGGVTRGTASVCRKGFYGRLCGARFGQCEREACAAFELAKAHQG